MTNLLKLSLRYCIPTNAEVEAAAIALSAAQQVKAECSCGGPRAPLKMIAFENL